MKKDNEFVLYDPKYLDSAVNVALSKHLEDPTADPLNYVSAGIRGGALECLYGYISTKKMSNCGGANRIEYSAAQKGYGPLMYDIAMAASPNGLMADRTFVSPMARKVWQHYYYNRKDVVKTDLTKSRGMKNCPTHAEFGDEKPELDTIFKATRVPGYLEMVYRHIDFLRKTKKKVNRSGQSIDDTDIEIALLRAANQFFERYFVQQEMSQ